MILTVVIVFVVGICIRGDPEVLFHDQDLCSDMADCLSVTFLSGNHNNTDGKRKSGTQKDKSNTVQDSGFKESRFDDRRTRRPTFNDQRTTYRPGFNDRRTTMRSSFNDRRTTTRPSYYDRRTTKRPSFNDRRTTKQPYVLDHRNKPLSNVIYIIPRDPSQINNEVKKPVSTLDAKELRKARYDEKIDRRRKARRAPSKFPGQKSSKHIFTSRFPFDLFLIWRRRRRKELEPDDDW